MNEVIRTTELLMFYSVELVRTNPEIFTVVVSVLLTLTVWRLVPSRKAGKQ